MGQSTDLGDPWRRYMRHNAERLRRLDERLFREQIAKIEECLRRDAEWNLDYALESCDRWSALRGPSCPPANLPAT